MSVKEGRNKNKKGNDRKSGRRPAGAAVVMSAHFVSLSPAISSDVWS